MVIGSNTVDFLIAPSSIFHRYLQSDEHSFAHLPGGDIELCLPILLGPPGDDDPHVIHTTLVDNITFLIVFCFLSGP